MVILSVRLLESITVGHRSTIQWGIEEEEPDPAIGFIGEVLR